MQQHPREAWLRVGRLLKQRRPQLDPRYRVRRDFAKENGITDKTAQEVENAYRTNFTVEMIAAIERAYQIAPGAILKALEDPSLTELPPREPAAGHQPSKGAASQEPAWAAPPDDLPDDVIWDGLPDEAMQTWHFTRMTPDERRTLMKVIVGLFAQRYANYADDPQPGRRVIN